MAKRTEKGRTINEFSREALSSHFAFIKDCSSQKIVVLSTHRIAPLACCSIIHG